MQSTHLPRCSNCLRYEPSRLDGAGYCKAMPTLESRARMVFATSACRIKQWQPKPTEVQP